MASSFDICPSRLCRSQVYFDVTPAIVQTGGDIWMSYTTVLKCVRHLITSTELSSYYLPRLSTSVSPQITAVSACIGLVAERSIWVIQGRINGTFQDGGPAWKECRYQLLFDARQNVSPQ